MSTVRWLALAAAFLLLTAGGANAQDAGEGGGDADAGGGGDGGASAAVSPTSNALVAIRRSEPRSEVALSVGGAVSGRGRLTGLQRGALELEGSWSPRPRWEVFATLNAAAFRSLVGTAPDGTVVTQNSIALGSMTVGTTWVPISLPGGRFEGGFFLRFLLPTSTEVSGVHAVGVQPGLTFRGVATRWLAWFGGVSFRVSQTWGAVALPSPVGLRLADGTQTGMSAMLGIAFVPVAWLRVVAQCSGNAPFSRGNNTLTPGLAFRFVQGPLVAEIGSGLPLGGSVRTFSGFGKVSWRFGG